MNVNAIRIKIKLYRNGELKEMRRLQIDDPLFINDFLLFKEKLRSTFAMHSTAFNVTWTDCDGDVITIGNSDDLVAAFLEMNEIKLFNVEIGSNEEDDQDDGPEPTPAAYCHITCDVCNNRIVRYRYKCLQCPDYDLCLNCEHAGNHSHHIMMRLANLEIPHALPKIMGHLARTARKAAHHAAKEAHRAAKTSARFAHAAASSAGREFRCPRMNANSDSAVFDGSILANLAQSFFEKLPRTPQSQSSSAPSQPDPAPQNQPTEGHQAAQQMVNAVDQVMTNIFSALQNFIPQVPASPAPGVSTQGTPTANTPPPPRSVSSVASAGSQTSAPAETVAAKNIVKNVPMEVEPEKPFYPVLPTEHPLASAPVPAPDAGWTIVQGNLPSVNPDEAKYAEALQQLRKMGFSDNVDLLGLLKRYEGNIGFVVNHLFETNVEK